MWSNKSTDSVGLLPGRRTLGPLFLIACAPPFVMFLWCTLTQLDGSVLTFATGFWANPSGTLSEMWPTFRDPAVWKVLAGYLAFEMVLVRFVPYDVFEGPVTPAGNVPKYNANGFQCFVITLMTFFSLNFLGIFDGAWIYDHMGSLLSSLNVFALIFCSILYLKGRFFPSSSDSGTSGNPVFDFYWGTELFPRILGWDVKQVMNCRFAMMGWSLIIISCFFKSYQILGHVDPGIFVNVMLQLIYIGKFFYWETGYLASIDIMHDRAGFYIIWGVLSFLPCVYTSHSLYLAEHASNIPTIIAFAAFMLGMTSIYVNYDCDRQRQEFRRSKGAGKVWGKDPLFIEAKYKTESGEIKSSLLLGSGYWGLSRHFHYVPEILASLFWTFPVWTYNILPWFYVPYLTLLLFDRAHRDDARCRSKYGKYWDMYCKHVRDLIIPQTY